MASHDETLDPNAPQPPRKTSRPAIPGGRGGGAGETAPPDSRVQRQHARDDQRVAHPKLFGSYRILGVLGQGGMGVVYTAEQQHPKRRVALMVIRPLLGTRDMIKRFRLEADVLGRLEHPGIARIYEAGSADAGAGPQPFFAMELVKGRPLLVYAQAGKLALRDKLELIARVADAVHYAHEHGVIHRDLKPSNILVEESGQPKILDFGVARVTDADVKSATMQTDSGSLVGTVQYMSPEQAGGLGREIDARSDVYALGLIAYEILAGKYPFDLGNSGLFDALRIVREQDVPALSSHDRQLRGDVETIVHKAVEKERSRRYASAAELASDIRRHLAHRPICARPRSFSYVASRYLRRNRVLVGSVAAAMLVIALGAAWMTSGRQATAARRVNELSRRVDQELGKANWGSGPSVQSVRSAIDELAAASPADGAGARRRMNDLFAEHLRRAIYSPNVDAATIEKIDAQLALLAATDPDRAAALKADLAGRTSTPEPLLMIDATNPPPAGAPAAKLFRVAVKDGAAPVTFAAPAKARPGAAVPLGVNCGENTRAEVTLPPSWEQLPAVVGFAFIPVAGGAVTVDDRAADGYAMVLDVEYLMPDGQVPPAATRTMAAARAAGGNVTLTIRRAAKTLRTTKWKASELPPSKLRFVAARNGDRLSAQLNDLPPLVARDAFAPSLAGATVAVKLSNDQPIERLAVARKPLPATPHPLEAEPLRDGHHHRPRPQATRRSAIQAGRLPRAPSAHGGGDRRAPATARERRRPLVAAGGMPAVAAVPRDRPPAAGVRGVRPDLGEILPATARRGAAR
jgi:serine/threonine protein kinase